MADVKIIAEFFLISIAFSYTLFSIIASSELTGNGYIKLISNLSIGALVISLIVNLASHGLRISPEIYLRAIALICSVFVTLFHGEKKSLLMWILWALIVSCLGINLFMISPFVHGGYFLLTSTLLLGIITYSMTLGHWYLVVPKLSERPLKIAAIITWVILTIKIIGSLYSYKNNFEFFSEFTTLGSGYAFNNVMLLMRVLFGYVVILGMSIFNWKLVNMRSIQSSTGILYSMTFFVFIGELVSSYLFFFHGLFI